MSLTRRLTLCAAAAAVAAISLWVAALGIGRALAQRHARQRGIGDRRGRGHVASRSFSTP